MIRREKHSRAETQRRGGAKNCQIRESEWSLLGTESEDLLPPPSTAPEVLFPLRLCARSGLNSGTHTRIRKSQSFTPFRDEACVRDHS